jgi:asparagine synthase (glutamine-hydrolysing)
VCGIAAEIRFDGAPADVAAVMRMTEALRPRGPDGEGLWSLGNRALGHRRLKIIDLSDRAAQPLSDHELGLTIAFNGCIYNYRELRSQLAAEGYSFTTSSDTEALLKAYHHWGEGFVERLMGMFAFVLCEHDSGRTLLGRDRLGIKPLYLTERLGHVLRAASTLPALLAGGGVDTTLDPVALHHYLSWHAVVPAPRTILRGVSKLPPATLLCVESDGRRSERRYWEPRFERDAPGASPEEWALQVREALRAAVRRRMVADVPVGVLLSGGLDSSLIVGLSAEEGQRDLKTFSIGFPSSATQDGDEFEFSDLVAERFSTDHHRLSVTESAISEALPAAVEAMSEPMVSHDAIAFYLLSEQVARSIKVVQSGQGADEVFAGYHWYPPLSDSSATDQLDVYERVFFDRTHGEMAELVAPGLHVDGAVSREFVAEHFAREGADSPLDRALRLDQLVMLVEDPVKRVDNMTMAHGLEARTPFLDHELVELAARCPSELKLADGGKGVLRAAARGVVPDAIVDRPKGYFPVPPLVELQGRVLELVGDAMSSDAARGRGLWEGAYVERLLREPNRHMTPSGANKLWQMALLELWLTARGIV